jgi:hypothetical protein
MRGLARSNESTARDQPRTRGVNQNREVAVNAVFLLLCIGLGGGAGSGLVATPVEDAAPVIATTNAAADRLRAEAHGLFHDRRSWGRAARLLDRAAGMRAATDPGRSADYRLAGRLYAHLGALDASERAFVRAAESAHQLGAIADAAGAYLDAAHVAAHRGDRRAARAFVQQVELLSLSPHLDAAERDAIRRRVPLERE